MSDKTGIEWTRGDDGTPGATWNPVTGCTKVSAGCDHCYAETFAERWRGIPGHHFENGFDVTLRPERLEQPLRWTRPRRIFVNSMSDLFHESVPDGYIARVWDVMGRTPRHTYQILTKRHARMRSWVRKWADRAGDIASDKPTGMPPMPRGPQAVRAAYTSGRASLFADMLDSMGTPPEGCAYPLYDWMEGQRWWPEALPNAWLGVSVEDQKWADIRIPALLGTPAAVRFLSCEPLLGPVDLRTIPYRGDRPYWLDVLNGHYRSAERYEWGTDFSFGLASLGCIGWVICGGESGPKARPMHPAWARSLRDQCDSADVPFFFKQWGEWSPQNAAAWPLGDVWRNMSRHCWVSPDDGRTKPFGAFTGTDDLTWAHMKRTGKKIAGRELDGRTWDQFPRTAEPVTA